MSVTIETAKIYRSGSRRYLTKRAAIQAEARKIIEEKYPTERPYYENGVQLDSGWYWKDGIKRSDVIFRRLCRKVDASIGEAMKEPKP